MVYLNAATGEVRPARCGRLSCGYCVGRQAWRRSMAIGLAAPERAITLTLIADAGDPDPWPTARRRYRRTREWLRREGLDPGEWVIHVEPNPAGTGFHGHVWQHGPRIDKTALQAAAHHAGAGWSRIEKVRSAGAAGAYGLKGISYGLKGVDGDAGARYLAVNGGRLTHQSAGFFRAARGESLPVKQAEWLALRQHFGARDEGTWMLMTERGARSFLSVRPAETTGPASAIRSAGRGPAAGSPAVLGAS